MCFSPLADTYVTAICGQDVVLHCQNTTASPIAPMEWKKLVLSDYCLYFFSHQRCSDNYQRATFGGRVELLDQSLRDGNVSVLLRNVSPADTGLYTCLMITRNATINTSRKVFERRINLTVSECTKAPSSHSPQARGRPGIIASLILLLTVIAMLCGVVWIRKNKKHKTPDGETCSNV